MSRANTSSVDMADGLKNSYLATQQKNSAIQKSSTVPNSIKNEKRKEKSQQQKQKAKKKAKIAKTSRKKNK